MERTDQAERTERFDGEFRFPSLLAEGQRAQRRLLDLLVPLEYDDRVLFGIKLAIEEALVNAIKHGNGLDASRFVHIRYRADRSQFWIEIEDEGEGFAPETVPDPTIPENIERPSGRGILLMRSFMTECTFVPPGNICRLFRVCD